MRLTELNPFWLSNGGDGVTNSITGEPIPLTEKAAIGFDCPCGCDSKLCIPIKEGLGHHHIWAMEGDDFETLSLHPSIQRVGGCGTHFWVKNGEITP